MPITADDRRRSDSGFTLIEMLLVAVLLTTLAAMTAGMFGNIRATVTGNANLRKLESLMKTARETAINQRRAVAVTFTAPNRIRLTRQNLPAGTTVIADEYFENGVSFTLFGGLPDTPEGFGTASATDFGPALQLLFTASGTFTDQTGNPINGTVFLGLTNSKLTARALTFFGPTATLRSYRWDGSAWKR